MKRLKNLKMFILAVGLAFGLQFINASAMNTECKFCNLIPQINSVVEEKKIEIDELKNELERIKEENFKNIKEWIKFEQDSNSAVQRLSLNDENYSKKKKNLKEEYSKKMNEFKNAAKEYKEDKKMLLQEIDKIQKETKTRSEDVFMLKERYSVREREFSDLLYDILKKKHMLKKLEHKRDIQNEKYNRAWNDFQQQEKNSRLILLKRAKYLKELDELKEIDIECKKLADKIAEKDKDLMELGERLNDLDERIDQTEELFISICDEEDLEEKSIVLDHNMLRDIRINGTSKY